jgi:hypothetical protein
MLAEKQETSIATELKNLLYEHNPTESYNGNLWLRKKSPTKSSLFLHEKGNEHGLIAVPRTSLLED